MKLYHVTPTRNRAAIEIEGLDPNSPLNVTRSVWFYTDEHQAKSHAGWPHGSDIWVIDADETFLWEYTCWVSPWDDKACYSLRTIGPHYLKLMERPAVPV